MSNDLESRGLKEVTKFAVVQYDSHLGWVCEVVDSEERANEYKGYGDFAGMAPVKCIVPADA